MPLNVLFLVLLAPWFSFMDEELEEFDDVLDDFSVVVFDELFVMFPLLLFSLEDELFFLIPCLPSYVLLAMLGIL